MFEPENDIERALMRASQEVGERAAFARALMDAQIFVVLTAEGGSIVPGPNGTATVTEGATLKVESAQRGEEKLIAFFTSPARARAWFAGDHIAAPETMRGLFNRFPDAAYVLNPGADYGKEFTPAEVKRLLAGQFDDGPQTEVLTAPQQVLLAHPKERPQALIDTLGRELSALKGVGGAWLMLAMRAGQADQSWMLGVEHSGDWNDVRAAIGRAVAGDVLGGRMLDATPLSDSPFAETLRTGIPLIAAKRGFLSKLFR
jgi:hypothetical protein